MADTYPPAGGSSWSFGLGIGGSTVDDPDAMNTQNSHNVPSLFAEEYNNQRPRSFYHSDRDNIEPYNAYTVAQTTDPYKQFERGFSDDEGDNFDRLFHPMLKASAQNAYSTSAIKQNKSPRRFDDSNLEEIGRIKKHKSSIFGGPIGFSDFNSNGELVAIAGQGQKPIFGNTSYEFDDEAVGTGQPRTNEVAQQSQSKANLQGDENRQPVPVNVSRGFGLAPSDTLSDYRGSPVPSSEHSYHMPNELRKEMEQNPYELRTGFDRNIPGAWMDRDQSGNFDPEEERKKIQLKKAKIQERKKKARQPKQEKERIPKLIVRLPFEAIGTVLNLTDCEQNWPEDWSDVDSEYERERAERRALYRQNTPGIEKQTPILDPAQRVDDLTGHPAARGCKDCRQRGDLCSMTTSGTWPCKQCLDNQVDCVPIVTPKLKGKCNRCTETCGEDEDNYCSFEMVGIKPHKICQQCVKEGFMDCVAGVPENYTAPRIDLNEIMYGMNRKWATCTNCRATGKKCSVKTKAARGPCSQCKRLKIGCTFYDKPPKVEMLITKRAQIPSTVREEADSSKNRLSESPIFTAADLADLDDDFDLSDAESLSQKSTPEIELEDAQGHRGMSARINTSFAHPIQFNFLPTETSICSFCEMPTFGLFGHFERSVYVIRWHNGLGYTELQSGYRQDWGETIMCHECTSSRIQTVICEKHDMRALEERNGPLDFDHAAELLMCAEPRSATAKAQLKRWCSMCLTPASFTCCQPQPSICGGEYGNEEWLEGCGLALCHACEARLREVFDGNCHEMVYVLDVEPKAKSDGGESSFKGVVRADVGFLKPDGLLMKTVEANAEMNGKEMEPSN